MTAMREEVQQKLNGDSIPATRLPPMSYQRDISKVHLFLEMQQRQDEILQTSQNKAVDFSQIQYSPDGKFIAGVATICHRLEGLPATRLAIIEVLTGAVARYPAVGDFEARPKWSQDGKVVSFLSQVDQCCQLHLLDVVTKEITQVTRINGTIEQQYWSPDGKSILLTVAGREADKSGVDGGVPLFRNEAEAAKTWLPSIDNGTNADAYRTAWVHDVATSETNQVSPGKLNVWQAVWISATSIAGICSDLPGEEHWYRSTLREVNIHSQTVRELFVDQDQMEGLRASPDGSKLAFISSVASDRQIVRGDLHILDARGGGSVVANTDKINIGCLEWASEDEIVAAGQRDNEEFVLHYNVPMQKTTVLWHSGEESVGSYYVPELTTTKTDALQCAFVRQGWRVRPTLSYITADLRLNDIIYFSSADLYAKIQKLCTVSNFKWSAPDGLEIYGFLLSPPNPGPHPTILFVHGGPVWQWRPRYLGSNGNMLLIQAVLAEGYAIFKPNPRGSAGRGQAFARHVYGDMGGADTYDYLSGLDHLVAMGKADPARLGVTGASYGGFMSSWLVTQTDRFKAAAPVAPVTNWVSFQYTTHISSFSTDFLQDDPHDLKGKFYTRSPLHHVRNVKTPTLIVCGERDKNTPPGQAVEFHRALLAHGKTSVLLSYPEEGHGVRLMPAYFDFCARMVEWFKYYV